LNVEIGTEAAQFPEKKFISGIFLAVRHRDPRGAAAEAGDAAAISSAQVSGCQANCHHNGDVGRTAA
jgi:hypothetical protein